MISCKEATRLVSESLDRELTFRQRFSLRLHLMVCYFCRRYHRQLRFLHALLGRYGEIEEEEPALEDVKLTPEARDRIREKLRNENAS